MSSGPQVSPNSWDWCSSTSSSMTWWDRVHPQQVCRWHQTEWCSWCHPGGLGQTWEVGFPLKFNKSNSKVVHLSWGKPRHEYRLGEVISERIPLKGIPGCFHGQKAGYEPTVLTGSPEGQLYPGLQKAEWSASRGRWLLLYSALLRPQLECYILLWGP